jgi:hypothetical protein
MDTRYQVFVSSTFMDLEEERQEVMQALLELDCIPAGMELFPAANDDQWSLIKRVIDDCDYYIVIIGGRYGSLGSQGLSYTEMEYRYALDRGKPVLAFLHKSPGELPANKTEQSNGGRQKLSEFRELAQQRVCRFWQTPGDLGGQVSRSLIKLIKSYPAVGWVKADRVPTIEASQEIVRLHRRVEDLELELASAASKPPIGSEELAQGNDRFRMHYHVHVTEGYVVEVVDGEADATWNQIFRIVGPLLMDPVSESRVRFALDAFVLERDLRKNPHRSAIESDDYEVKLNHQDFQTIKIQLRALGLIMRAPAPAGAREPYWMLTPYGDAVMTRLIAVRSRGAVGQDKAEA